jgi:hypothetical protein
MDSADTGKKHKGIPKKFASPIDQMITPPKIITYSNFFYEPVKDNTVHKSGMVPNFIINLDKQL